MVYPGVRRAELRKSLDRDTWAGATRIEFVHDVFMTPETLEIEIDFKEVFEAQPLFRCGVELYEGESLIEGDYPSVSAAVRTWRTTNDGIVEPQKAPYYIGALVWVTATAANSYLVRYRLSFEGIVFSNVSTFRSTLNG